MKVRPIVADDAEDLEGPFAAVNRERPGALIILPILATRRAADLARRHRFLSITSGVRSRAFPELGGLMSYGASSEEYYRRAAVYVDKILKGAKAGDLPVEQPTTFELVVNLRTAKAIGHAVPAGLVLRAATAIE